MNKKGNNRKNRSLRRKNQKEMKPAEFLLIEL